MIVTRRRKKPFPFKRLLLPLVAIAAVAFALWWKPSRDAIANGPLAPVWSRLAAPFDMAMKDKQIGDDAATIAQLKQQLADAQTQGTAKDKKIAGMQKQIDDANVATVASRGGGAASVPGAGASSMPSAGSVADLAAAATADERRTAQNWAAMEPENAAKVVQKLPVSYVARVLAVMSPDAVGPILDALPAAYAAALTQEHPELRR